MAGFDPDAFLAESDDDEQGFNPDAFLAEDDVQPPVDMGGEFSDIVSQEMSAEPEAEPQLPEVSQGKAALLGASQGATMGFSDEIGAGVQSSADRIQSLLNRYTGLVDKSPTQVSEELAGQGFAGDIGPTSSSRTAIS